jgi:hypothetical protein
MTATLAKLGARPGDAVLPWGLPETLRAVLGPLPEGPAPRLLLAACPRAADVAPAAAALLPRYAPGLLLWFAYPKLSGPLRSDISRDPRWQPLAEAGFLAVAQVSLDAAWSASRVRPRGEVPRVTRRGG